MPPLRRFAVEAAARGLRAGVDRVDPDAFDFAVDPVFEVEAPALRAREVLPPEPRAPARDREVVDDVPRLPDDFPAYPPG